MAWKPNPRVITKEQFSDGTTIDGNRIDNALQDVVDRVNSVPQGDLRKRWVPITYVAGWSPQSPKYWYDDTALVGRPTNSALGRVYPMHRWPWMHTVNNSSQVAAETLGSDDTDAVRFTNPFRLKGVNSPCIHPFGALELDYEGAIPFNDKSDVSEHYAWTRSWFLEKPSILDSIDLILETDHASATLGALVYQNRFKYGPVTIDGVTPESDDMGLVITAAVDSEFAREDRNLADIEILRRHFRINNDTISAQSLPSNDLGSPTYYDMEPPARPNGVGLTNGPYSLFSTLQGVCIRLNNLNIPIHQNARLRISVAIPKYSGDVATNTGWNHEQTTVDDGEVTFDEPWYQQKMHMTVTMLEEVMRG